MVDEKNANPRTTRSSDGSGSPATIDDEVLGRITWISRSRRWETQVQLNEGVRIAVTLDVPIELLRGDCLNPVKSLVARLQTAGDTAFKRKVSSDLLELYNRQWRAYANDEPEPPIDCETFSSRLKLLAIDVEYCPGEPPSAKLVYDADYMFTEHFVTVEASSTGDPGLASIQ